MAPVAPAFSAAASSSDAKLRVRSGCAGPTGRERPSTLAICKATNAHESEAKTEKTHRCVRQQLIFVQQASKQQRNSRPRTVAAPLLLQLDEKVYKHKPAHQRKPKTQPNKTNKMYLDSWCLAACEQPKAVLCSHQAASNTRSSALRGR